MSGGIGVRVNFVICDVSCPIIVSKHCGWTQELTKDVAEALSEGASRSVQDESAEVRWLCL
eukprot:5324559-Amphidinium_carterae.2